MWNICFTSTSHLVLLDNPFVLFLPIHRCVFWFNLKYIFVSLCKYSRTPRMKLLTWCRVVSPGFSDWAGLGLKFVKIFRAGIQNFFIALVATNFFFRDYVCSTHRGNFCEWSDCDFFQLILFANTAAFFSSLLGLISHSFWEGDSDEEISTRWLCFREINHSRDSWLVSRSLQASLSCL